MLAQVKVADKSNEIPAILRLLQLLDLAGDPVTIDAMGCQKKIVRAIVQQEADYVLGLKENPSALYDDGALFFDEARDTDFALSRYGHHEDVSFAEDSSRIRQDQGDQVFATLGHIALNLRRRENPHKPGIKARRKRVGEGILSLEGDIHCFRRVVLRVEKRFQSRYSGGLRRIRCYSYRYVAWVEKGHPVLRYQNVHRNDDDYHPRVFNPLTGEEVFYERLERYQFPLFNEVLDEIDIVTRPLAGLT